jgi:energy-coupling factor transporter ATP-binding protein EcfA2
MSVILISGPQGSGKTTLAKALIGHLETSRPTYHVKFADPLYAMHEAMREAAERYDIPFARKEGELLQYLGTEWGRKKDPNLWVKATLKRVELIKRLEHGSPLIVIDDCRFPNEIAAFPDAFKIRLTASEDARRVRAEGWRSNTAHPSETALDALPASVWDLVIDTTASTPAVTLAHTFLAAESFFNRS